jgi:hypothetical protein
VGRDGDLFVTDDGTRSIWRSAMSENNPADSQKNFPSLIIWINPSKVSYNRVTDPVEEV